MFFSFSLFPPGISARCSRSALPPGFPPGIPSGGAWLAERFRAPSAFGGLSVFAGVSALRPFSAFPSGISARRLGLRYRLLFPVCVPARHFRPAFGSALPPVVPGLRFRPAFPSGGAWFAERFRAPSAFAGLVRFCLPVFCMRLLPHTAKNAPAGIRTLACSAAAPAAGIVLSNRPAAPSAAESAPYGLQSYI